MKKIAIQGIKGSFHHNTALMFFIEKIHIIECETFNILINKVLNNKADYGVLAIENSYAGDIHENYHLIINNPIKIIGETYLHIQHHLMGLYNQKQEDIKKVISHFMAIRQCKKFFLNTNIQIESFYDTAGAAKHIQENKIKGLGVIAPKIASKIYNLKIYNYNIQDSVYNYTRFFIITSINNIKKYKKINKAIIKIKTHNSIGSLNNITNTARKFTINISKIKLINMIKYPWQYIFIFEINFTKINNYTNFLNIIKNKKYAQIDILGEY
jgi:prephenate dehydratase